MKGPFNITQNNLEIIYSSDKNFQNLWNNFLKDYNIFSYKYELSVIKYYELISNKCENKSFLIKNHEAVLAICPLIIEAVNENKQASIYNGKDFIPISLFNKHLTLKQKNNIEKILFGEIKNSLETSNAKKAFFQADCISLNLENIYDTYLDKELALDMSTYHHIMDLTLNEEDIWKEIRHSSKTIINKGLEIFDFKVFDINNFDDYIGEKHRKLHHEISGKITRPIESFKQMASWVKEGQAILIEQSFKKEIAQLIYVVMGGKSAAGASVVENLKINTPIPMTHSLNFFIYQEMKKRGIKYYDVGLTSFRSTMFNSLTRKEKDINYFKRGFGTRNYPLRLWAWFKDKKEEIDFLKNKLNKYENEKN